MKKNGSFFGIFTHKNGSNLFFIGERTSTHVPPTQPAEPICVKPSQSCAVHPRFGSPFHPVIVRYTKLNGGDIMRKQEFVPMKNGPPY